MPGVLGEAIKTEKAIAPQAAVAGAITGLTVNRDGYNYAVLVVETGAAAGAPTAVDVDVTVQESADGTTWVDVPGGPHIANLANDSRAEYNLPLINRAKYIRCVAAVAFTGGTSPTVGIGATWILGDAVKQPV